MNNKGFMMAELVVVSSIIVVFLTGLYLSYNKIFSVYKLLLDYNDVNTLYNLSYYRDILNKNDELQNISLSPVNVIDKIRTEEILNPNDKVFLINNKQKQIEGNEINSISGVNLTFKDYVKYLANSVDLTNTNYVMIMERCDDEKKNCKYAYLEVPNGQET